MIPNFSVTPWNLKQIQLIENESFEARFQPQNKDGSLVTWCNQYLFSVLKKLGYNIASISNDLGPGYTRANDIWDICYKKQLVNKDRFNPSKKYFFTWFNVNGPGHVALYKYSIDAQVYVQHAGRVNGEFKLETAFAGHKPSFVCLDDI